MTDRQAQATSTIQNLGNVSEKCILIPEKYLDDNGESFITLLKKLEILFGPVTSTERAHAVFGEYNGPGWRIFFAQINREDRPCAVGEVSSFAWYLEVKDIKMKSVVILAIT